VRGEHVVADDRAEGAEPEPRVDAVRLPQVAAPGRIGHPLLGDQRVGDRPAPERLGLGRQPQLGGQPLGEPGQHRGGVGHLGAAALHDRPLEQPARERRAEQAPDAHRARPTRRTA
jgi:hypothetical protein